MLDESVLRAVSLYFYLSLPDEKRAHSASISAINKIQKLPSSTNRAMIVNILHRIRPKAMRFRVRFWPFKKGEVTWVMPNPKLDLQIWRNFTQRAVAEESEAVLFSRILGFTDSEIAAGLNVSEGTVRYRVGRGLRTLGGIAGG